LPSPLFAALAGLGCVWMGMAWAFSLSRRVRALRAWARVLAKMEAGLAYRTHTLEELLQRALEGEENHEVFCRLGDVARQMSSNPMLSLGEAMGDMPMPELTPADLAALSPLWRGLGAGDSQSQHGLLQSVRAALDAQIVAAADKEGKDRRLATTLGIIGGAAVFLFLL